ncbi:SEC-C metal-binding domain-containing protein, partial [Pseudomonas sp. SIMBA_044]
FVVNIPTERTEENAHIYEDATRMAQPKRTVNFNQPKNVVSPAKTKKLGRNDPCPCGSGLKYKKCHGR